MSMIDRAAFILTGHAQGDYLGILTKCQCGDPYKPLNEDEEQGDREAKVFATRNTINDATDRLERNEKCPSKEKMLKRDLHCQAAGERDAMHGNDDPMNSIGMLMSVGMS